MIDNDPTHSTIGEENVRQRLRREAERGMQPVPAKFREVRVSLREMK
jgi:hypothetical protein